MEMNDWYRFIYRLIMSQRDITVADLADHLGVSRSAISENLGRLGDDRKWLFRIDRAITEITEKRGGLDKVVPSTEEGHKEFREQLEHDRLATNVV